MRLWLYLKWGKELWGKEPVKAESQINKMDMEWKGSRTQTQTKDTGGGVWRGTVIFLGPPWVSAHLLSHQSQLPQPGVETGRGLGAEAEPRRASSGPGAWTGPPPPPAARRSAGASLSAEAPAPRLARCAPRRSRSSAWWPACVCRAGAGARRHGQGTEIAIAAESLTVTQLGRRVRAGADREGEGPLPIRQRVPGQSARCT